MDLPWFALCFCDSELNGSGSQEVCHGRKILACAQNRVLPAGQVAKPGEAVHSWNLAYAQEKQACKKVRGFHILISQRNHSMKTIGISIGDPNGIGPEIAIKAWRKMRPNRQVRVCLIGEHQVLKRTAKKIGIPAKIGNAQSPKGHGIPLFECPQEKPTPIAWGMVTPETGAASLSYACLGAMLAMQGKIDALVTCPISKEAVILGGNSGFTGHTEYLSELTGAKEAVLSYWHGNFRIAHVTSHVSLREAIGKCKAERIIPVAMLFAKAIRNAGIPRPRLGICGLNPHAGEGGAYGDEEIDEIAPAVAKLKKSGIRACGPIPPDIAFARMKGGTYDGVVAMVHDQGSIALKTLFFSLGPNGESSVGGVNVSLGLPIVRTSVDHGTSFDIAGKGIADPTSLMDALDLAGQLARKRSRSGSS